MEKMRYKITFDSPDIKEITIDRDYRRYFISFLKSVFERSFLFGELYDRKTVKPFTFSVYLGKMKLIDENNRDKIFINPPLNLIFSTGNFEVFASFYNGVLQLKKENKGITFPRGIALSVKDIILQRNYRIKNNHVVFKTIGIAVLTDPEKDASNFNEWFLIPEEGKLEKFEEVLKKRTIERYERIKGEKIKPEEIKLTHISNVKEIMVKHYDGFIRGFKGIFSIESHPEILQFLYDYGLGVRTGQGFGLLDIISEG